MIRHSSYLCLLIIITLIGCANRSLSAQQCVAGDWRTVGYSDGVKGINHSALLKHQDACGRHGIVPDTSAYRSGWAEGISDYCTPERGFDLGRSGGQYRPVCPNELTGNYRGAFDDGRALYLAHRDVARLEAQLNDTEQRIDAIGTALMDTASGQLSPGMTMQDRLDLLAQSKELIDERDRLSNSLPALAVELDRAQQRLNALQHSIAYR